MIWIWLLFIVCGLTIRKSKLLSYLQVLCIILFMTFNDNNPDYANNFTSFIQIRNGYTSVVSGNILYNMFFKVFGIFGNYHMVIFALSMVSMILIYKSISLYTDSYSFCFSLYMIASFVIDATQLKNLLAFSVWIFFARFLYLAYLKQNTIKNVLWYMLGVGIAALFHASFAITALYVIILLVDTKKLFVIIGWVGILSVMSSVYIVKIMDVLSSWISMQQFAFMKFVYSKIFDYSLSYNGKSVSTRMYLEIIFFVLLMAVFWRIRLTSNYKTSEKNRTFMKFVMSMNLVAMTMLPLLFLSVEFYRFQRNLLIMDYALFGSMLYRRSLLESKIKASEFVIGIYALIPALFYLYIDAILWNFEHVFLNLFHIY